MGWLWAGCRLEIGCSRLAVGWLWPVVGWLWVGSRLETVWQCAGSGLLVGRWWAGCRPVADWQYA